MNSPPSRRPIGQILISQGVISEDQLRIALLEQMKSNQPVGKLLVALGFVSEATLRDALGSDQGTVIHWWDHESTILDKVAEQLELSEEADRNELVEFATRLRSMLHARA